MKNIAIFASGNGSNFEAIVKSNIPNVEVSFLLTEQSNGSFRINFRSKGKYIINGIAKAMGGGGHKLAAGALADGTLDEVLPKVLSKTQSALAQQNGHPE